MIGALLLLLQAGAALPGTVTQSPDDAATLGASIAISQCIFMREDAATPAAFIAGVAPLRQRLATDPRLAGVSVDDAGGRGCRVSFTGTAADAERMSARARMAPNQLLFSRQPLPTGSEHISTTLIDPRR